MVVLQPGPQGRQCFVELLILPLFCFPDRRDAEGFENPAAMVVRGDALDAVGKCKRSGEYGGIAGCRRAEPRRSIA